MRAGFRLHQAGRLNEAIAAYRQAVSLDPSSDIARNLLGLALCVQGQLAEGETCFRDAIAINASNVEALNNLASVLKDRGALPEAEKFYRRALDLHPDFPPAWNNLGSVYLALRRESDAERCFRSALAIDAGNADAHNNLGVVLRPRGLLNEAEAQFRAAVAANPALAQAWCGLADVLSLRGLLDEAEACCKRALELKAGDFDARKTLATIANLRRAPDVAEAFCDALLRERPQDVGALNNRACAATIRVDYRTAERIYRDALRIDPTSAVTRFNLSTALLMLGDYCEGFALYESRFDATRRAFTPSAALNEKLRARPRWHGEALHGGRLLVWAEQGLGDSIMMLRYLPELRARGVESVTVLCQRPLQRLVRAMPEINQVVVVEHADAVPEFGAHCPMMSLPFAFETSAQAIPARVPYVTVPETMLESWRARLGVAGPTVGLAWAGDRTLRDDARRSIPLDLFAPLFAVEGVRFVSLQKGDAAAEWRRAGRDGGQFIDACDDFLDTAALVANLDLVISVDTAVVHVAGALGRRVWLLNRFGSEWRWGLEGEESRWYPSMKIFREPASGQWHVVLARIARQLAAERHNLCLRPASII